MIDDGNLFGFLAFLKLAANSVDFQPCYMAAVQLKLGRGQEIPEWLRAKLLVGARSREWIVEMATMMWLYGRPVR